VGEPATEAEIADVLAAYRRSAAAARAAGFDGIEIHGAHGYLIDQFLWSATNRRGDGWGGDAVARTRFAAAVVRACREGTGPGYPIALRVSQWKQQDYAARLAETPQALAALLAPLVQAGADILHCSTRRFWEPEFPGSPLNLAGWVRHLLGVPTISVGSVGLDTDAVASLRQGQDAGVAGVEALLERMARDEFDLIAIGRALLGDADWFAKLRRGSTDEWRPFTPAAFKTLA
jgi:2,4-dienoyl-CoA reductase-like NADH-dependent reductase (Old Yellow Enzyme family)